MKKATVWLNKHPYWDRYLDLIIGAIIGAIISDIYSIIREAKRINAAFTNYRFWLLICIFIIVSIIFFVFAKFRVKDHNLDDKKQEAKEAMIDKITSDVLGIDNLEEALKMGSKANTFIEKL